MNKQIVSPISSSTSEEIKRMYNIATWRMYQRITTARIKRDEMVSQKKSERSSSFEQHYNEAYFSATGGGDEAESATANNNNTTATFERQNQQHDVSQNHAYETQDDTPDEMFAMEM
eukprot:CAMPEP_0178959820 /NCGR_PEP_ID=MMETSP0789-20121207/12543_1 /TAXON_ID=3005 /ORGANISM="Rhizosolenia setigera, Strain CCMP 1694" /LENGTH=116 /DNA_ID=CAMNT_0020642945 /DNA_START=15 /DNA_END=365 /DNA_ORIENTATION=+